MILLLSLGCINDEIFFQRVDIAGRLLSNTPEEPVYVSAHHAWFGQGDLRIPAKQFDSQRMESADDFTWILDVPVREDAEGLVLYAWQDLDGDGDFCGLSGTEEFSGLYVVDYPTFSASVEISIQNPCAASESLWEEIAE